MSSIEIEPHPPPLEPQLAEPLVPSDEPTPEELSSLSPLERFAFRFTHRMNQGAPKRFWNFMQRTLGAGWITISTYNIMRIYGFEHFERTAPDRPVLLVANHRSFFDMYAVSAMIYRLTKRDVKLFFPVRGRFFYDSILGMFVNFIMGWWSMYPPIFTTPEKRVFDKFALRRLTALCHEGAGHVIGFHPEGTRNRNPDPYSFLRPQPGVGKLIKDAQPQVIPVFIAGLDNSLPRQVINNWIGRRPIRIHFGPALDYSEHLTKRESVRTYKEIADFVMTKISELGEQDRKKVSGEQ
jgi:1-acyl-sn-glycerol-3-phosphate acyltransferase